VSRRWIWNIENAEEAEFTWAVAARVIRRHEMDLRIYYQKVRDVEAKIAEEFPFVVSRETPDGGKAGVKTQVPRRIAAKLIVEGLAELPETKEKHKAN